MTPREQLISHCPEEGRFGDCYRTCIAAILDLPNEAVPHFYREENYGNSGAGEREAREWLGERGLALTCIAYAGSSMTLAELLEILAGYSNAPMILCGASNIGSNHAVVILDGAIVCDPSGNGIVAPLDCDQWQVEIISTGRTWRARTEKK